MSMNILIGSIHFIETGNSVFKDYVFLFHAMYDNVQHACWAIVEARSGV